MSVDGGVVKRQKIGYNGDMVKITNQNKNLKRKLRDVFQKEPKIGFAYIFGSRARDDIKKNSDYDFAVFINENNAIKRHKILFRVAGDISKRLKTDDIDVKSLSDIENIDLKYNIISEGVLLFEREPYRAIIEPRILNEYFDFTYLLSKYGFIAK